MKPAWLRPASLLFVTVLHAGLLLNFAFKQSAPVAPPDAITVEVVQSGAIETEVAAAPLSEPVPDDVAAPEEETPAIAPAPPPPTQLAETPPVEEANDAPPLPVASLETPVLSMADPEVPPPTPVPQMQAKEAISSTSKPEEPAPHKKTIEKKVERPRAPPSVERSEKSRTGATTKQVAGAENGHANVTGQTRASYGALVLAELHRHQFYPPAARAEGATGSVQVAFNIGPSGRIISHAITRSSGNRSLDAAADVMLREVHAPPPPGGAFSGSTIIRFSFAN